MNNTQKQLIVAMGHELIKRKLVAGSWGNISLRQGEEIAITPSGHGYADMQPEDIVILDQQGRVLEGKHVPSSESALHLAVYAACPEAGAIIHTHSIYASALAAMRKPVPALIEDSSKSVEEGLTALPTPSVAHRNWPRNASKP